MRAGYNFLEKGTLIIINMQIVKRKQIKFPYTIQKMDTLVNNIISYWDMYCIYQHKLN